ncbi:MAG: hypothetical protein HQ581_07115, partial [Planctomycetes bacterium]|nr:hypothetical protein [Planctomycetota bacterium]
ARICYRQTDTTGQRYGSYFAHVLTRELHDGGNPRPHWNGMDALQLWDAPHWVEEDVPPSGDSYRLPRITDLASWRGKEKPAIDDEVLQGFFTAPAGGPFHDPGNVIPSRWRALKPEQRTEAFASALRGFLASDPAPGKPLVLVIEPSMAALWFYGMLRLLPEGPLREAISFSTYEPDPTRCSTSLAATCFHEPAAGDLREEAYRGPGFVLNTFNNRQSADVGTNSQYAELILRALGACCRQGASQDSATATWWRGVDRVLRRLGPAGSTSREALENLAALENQAARMFDAAGVAPEKSSWKHRAFRDAVVRQLKSRGPLGATLRRVVGTPVHVPLVELLGSRTDHETAVNAVGYLVASLPDGQIAAMLARDVPDNCKVQILVQYVRKSSEGQNVPSLPPGCEDFWSSQLAPRVLAQLAADEEALLKRFCNAARRKLSEPISVGMQLIRAARSMRADDSARNRLEEEVRDEDLLQLHGEHGANLFEQPSLAQSALGELLKRMLDSLPSFPGEFDRRFALLKDAKDHLPSEQDQDTLQHWKECQDAIRNVDYWVPKVSVSHLRRQFDLRAIKKLALQGRPLPHLPTELVNLQNACAELADAAVKVIPPSAYHADESVRRLRELAEQVLGHEMMPEEPWPFDALWQKVHLCLAGNGFPRQQHLGTMRTDSSATATGSAPKGKSIAAVAVVVTLLVAAVVVLVLSMSEAPSRGKGKATAGKNQGDRETGTNPADTTPGPKEPRTPPGNPSPIPPEGVVVDPPHEEPVRPTIHDAPPLPGGRSLSVLGNRSNFGGSPQLWLDGQGDLSRLSLRVGTSGELLPEWYTENYFAAWQVLRADKQPSEVFLPETNRFYDESHQVELAGGQPEMLIRVEFWLKGSQGQPPRRMFVTPRWPLPALRPRQTMTAEFTLNRGRDGEIVPLWNGLPTDRKRGHTAPAGGDPVSDDTEPPEPTEPAEPAQPERVHADWGTTADLTSVGGETSFRTGNPRLLADRTVGTITVQIEDPPAWFSDRAVARWQAVCLIDGQSRRFPDANKCFDLDTEAELDRQPQQTAVQL